MDLREEKEGEGSIFSRTSIYIDRKTMRRKNEAHRKIMLNHDLD